MSTRGVVVGACAALTVAFFAVVTLPHHLLVERLFRHGNNHCQQMHVVPLCDRCPFRCSADGRSTNPVTTASKEIHRGKIIQLGTIAGIRIQVHWTFLLIVAWVALTSFFSGMNWLGAILNVGFILVLFGCVLLHELGHALAARMFGIPTRDITLLPIGGLARLERMPRKPVEEMVVALAGPAVNVVIAGLLLAVLLPTVGLQSLAAVPLGSGGFLQQLLVINVMLVAFNMLPAFPLDGGRVFRACWPRCSTIRPRREWPPQSGRFARSGSASWGLANPFLLIIAAFIFFGAAAEARQVAVREQYGGYQVRDGMLRRFRPFLYASVREIALNCLVVISGISLSSTMVSSSACFVATAFFRLSVETGSSGRGRDGS